MNTDKCEMVTRRCNTDRAKFIHGMFSNWVLRDHGIQWAAQKNRLGRMARQPRAEAGDGYGTIGQQTDMKGWINILLDAISMNTMQTFCNGVFFCWSMKFLGVEDVNINKLRKETSYSIKYSKELSVLCLSKMIYEIQKINSVKILIVFFFTY
jgi:hypothetical protein